MLHRPMPAAASIGAHIWLSWSPDLKHWGDHQILLRARRGGWWDANKIGLSPPPLRTDEGWLILYHGVRMTASGAIYRLGLALLDLEDPTRSSTAPTNGCSSRSATTSASATSTRSFSPAAGSSSTARCACTTAPPTAGSRLATARISDLLDWLRQTAGRMRRDDIWIGAALFPGCTVCG